jgi:hypothetical protein
MRKASQWQSLTPYRAVSVELTGALDRLFGERA